MASSSLANLSHAQTRVVDGACRVDVRCKRAHEICSRRCGILDVHPEKSIRAPLVAPGFIVAALLSRCTCETPILKINDGGQLGDAGTRLDDGGEPTDGGSRSDAGVVTDAGSVVDAGPTCDWGPNPPIPFTCEGDEDWCDPAGDTPDAETDLLAMWSRVEGDTLILQFRFAAPPFRNNLKDDIYVEFSSAIVAQSAGYADGAVSLCEDTTPPGSNFCLPGNVIVFVSWAKESPIPAERSYPPEQYGTDPAVFTPDRCAASLGRTLPLLELRLPLAQFSDENGEVTYAAMLPADTSGPPWDFSWPADQPAFVHSKGGRSNDDSDLVSFCELSCPTVTP
jgi:hypothetical protein